MNWSRHIQRHPLQRVGNAFAISALLLAGQSNASASTAIDGSGNCSVGATLDTQGDGFNDVCFRSGGSPPPANPYLFDGNRAIEEFPYAIAHGAFSLDGTYARLISRTRADAAVAVDPLGRSTDQAVFASADTLLRSYDTVTPTSLSGLLAPGSAVPVTMTLKLHLDDTLTQAAVGQAFLSGGVHYEFDIAGVSQTFDLGIDQTTGTFSNDFIFTLTGMTHVGEASFFEHFLALSQSVEADLGFVGDATSATDPASIANLLNGTAQLFLSTDNPDIALLTDSGHDYRLPVAVPEPWTPLLLLAGPIAWACGRSRQRSKVVLD